VSIDLQACDFEDWLVDEIRSQSFDVRVEIVMRALDHSSSLPSLLAARGLSIETRYRLAESMRLAAERLESIGV
jgi:hypothetical protein